MATVPQISTLIESIIANLYHYTKRLETDLHDNYFTKEEIESIRENSWTAMVVDELPERGDANVMYLMYGSEDGINKLGILNEYLWLPTKSRYEMIGNTEWDMKKYYKVDELNALLDTKAYLIVPATKMSVLDNDANYMEHYILDEFPERYNNVYDELPVLETFSCEFDHEECVRDTLVNPSIIHGLLKSGKVTCDNVPEIDKPWWLKTRVHVTGEYVELVPDGTKYQEEGDWDKYSEEGYIKYGNSGIFVNKDGVVRVVFETPEIDESDANALPTRNAEGSSEITFNLGIGDHYLLLIFDSEHHKYFAYSGDRLDDMILRGVYRKPVEHKNVDRSSLKQCYNTEEVAKWEISAHRTGGAVQWDLVSTRFCVNNTNLVAGSDIHESSIYTINGDDYFNFDENLDLFNGTQHVRAPQMNNYYKKVEMYQKENLLDGITTLNTLIENAYDEFDPDNFTDHKLDYWEQAIFHQTHGDWENFVEQDYDPTIGRDDLDWEDYIHNDDSDEDETSIPTSHGEVLGIPAVISSSSKRLHIGSLSIPFVGEGKASALGVISRNHEHYDILGTFFEHDSLCSFSADISLDNVVEFWVKGYDEDGNIHTHLIDQKHGRWMIDCGLDDVIDVGVIVLGTQEEARVVLEAIYIADADGVRIEYDPDLSATTEMILACQATVTSSSTSAHIGSLSSGEAIASATWIESDVEDYRRLEHFFSGENTEYALVSPNYFDDIKEIHITEFDETGAEHIITCPKDEETRTIHIAHGKKPHRLTVVIGGTQEEARAILRDITIINSKGNNVLNVWQRFRKLKYIEGDGVAFVKTHYHYNPNYTYKVKYCGNTLSGLHHPAVLGARMDMVVGTPDNDSFNIFVYASWEGTSGYAVIDSFQRTVCSATSNLSEVVEIEISKNEIKYNGTVVASGTKQASGIYDIILFGINTGDTFKNSSKAQIYSFEILDEEGYHVSNMVPVYSYENEEYGFVDLEDYDFHGNNASSGEFTGEELDMEEPTT